MSKLKVGDVVMLIPVPRGGVIENCMDYDLAGELDIIVDFTKDDFYVLEKGTYPWHDEDGEEWETIYHESELLKIGVL